MTNGNKFRDIFSIFAIVSTIAILIFVEGETPDINAKIKALEYRIECLEFPTPKTFLLPEPGIEIFDDFVDSEGEKIDVTKP
jgi:hypothetical protein